MGSPRKKDEKQQNSTTSLGKRRTFSANRQKGSRRGFDRHDSEGANSSQRSTMSNPRSSEYGSQATPMRVPAGSHELTKVAILGAAGGIGQPLSILLMMHCEYVQHLALHDLAESVRGVGIDLSHVDRQCKVTAHVGPEELADAVRGAKVIVIPAGLAQKPGMSRDDLFGSNAKIMYNLAKVCAMVAPEAMMAVITNPVNSLVPLVCEVYHRILNQPQPPQQSQQPQQASNQQDQQVKHVNFDDCFRRIFGVTTLDVIRASSLTARSAFFKTEPSGLIKDPSKINVPVIGGHAGKTILPILSQATPKLGKRRLVEDKATTSTLIESIQQAGIEVLNAKKGKGSATLAMAYAACRFTISLLRALQGEANIVECAYVRHSQPIVGDLDYFSTQLVLGRDGYIKTLPIGKLMPFEEQMIEEAVKELRLSIAKGEDFAKEHLSAEKP